MEARGLSPRASTPLLENCPGAPRRVERRPGRLPLPLAYRGSAGDPERRGSSRLETALDRAQARGTCTHGGIAARGANGAARSPLPQRSGDLVVSQARLPGDGFSAEILRGRGGCVGDGAAVRWRRRLIFVSTSVAASCSPTR